MASILKRGTTSPVSLKRPESGLVAFVEALQSIDTSAVLANLNATSISDNNGGRIEL